MRLLRRVRFVLRRVRRLERPAAFGIGFAFNRPVSLVPSSPIYPNSTFFLCGQVLQPGAAGAVSPLRVFHKYRKNTTAHRRTIHSHICLLLTFRLPRERAEDDPTSVEQACTHGVQASRLQTRARLGSHSYRLPQTPTCPRTTGAREAAAFLLGRMHTYSVLREHILNKSSPRTRDIAYTRAPSASCRFLPWNMPDTAPYTRDDWRRLNKDHSALYTLRANSIRRDCRERWEFEGLPFETWGEVVFVFPTAVHFGKWILSCLATPTLPCSNGSSPNTSSGQVVLSPRTLRESQTRAHSSFAFLVKTGQAEDLSRNVQVSKQAT